MEVWWVNYEYGPDVVPQGDEIAHIKIDAQLAVLVGDEPLVVFEGSLEDLRLFHKKLGAALDRFEGKRA